MTTDKTAIVTGLRGQDGSILAELLTRQGIEVYGLIRRTSQGLDLGCAANLEDEPLLKVVEGDLTDFPSLVELCNLAKPDYFFNCGAMSHVGTSFSQPIFTMEVNAVGVFNCLEAIRNSRIHTRFLQCSTSEMFGGMSSEPANEETPFHPRSPYGVSKTAAHFTVQNYRESCKMFACSTICFNHEEPGKRGPNFVTRKISMAVAKIKMGLQDKLALGNLDAKRDWGRAKDYCEGMIKVITAAEPEDYVLSTGKTHSVREFCEAAFSHVGLDYNDYVVVDPQYYRPCEVDVLVGDASKAYNRLGWSPRCSFKDLVKNMVDHDLRLLSP